MKILLSILLLSSMVSAVNAQTHRDSGDGTCTNPVIHADVPDMSMIRVGNTYYMSITTMHMSPGVPIMKSKDLVNWELVSYCYDILDDVDELNLNNGKSTYSRGSWASCIRYHKDTYYVSTFAQTTGKTYIYSTKKIEKGPWKTISFKPAYHDHTIFFDDDGSIYMIWGAGKLRMVELKEDLSGVKEGTEQVLIENASSPAGSNIMLQWNHNPVNELWSVTQRKGFLRLTTGRVDNDFLLARNTLTQRTIGPECSGSTSVDVSKMKDGDFAGLALLQKKFGLVGVKYENGTKSVVMVSSESGSVVEMVRVPLKQKIVYL